jgi:hypothetical protein
MTADEYADAILAKYQEIPAGDGSGGGGEALIEGPERLPPVTISHLTGSNKTSMMARIMTVPEGGCHERGGSLYPCD